MNTAIKSEKTILPYLTNHCIENGIGMYLESGLSIENYSLIKVDDFYKGLHLAIIPKSIDRLCVTNCINKIDGVSIYFVEIKNIKDLTKLYTISPDDVYNKYRDTINDFCIQKYSHIFNNMKYKVKDVYFYIITDPFNLCGTNYTETALQQLFIGSFIEALLLRPPLEFRGKFYMIEYKVPFPFIKRT